MWNREAIELYTQYLTAQEQAVLEAVSNGIVALDKVKEFVSAKLANDIDSDYITAVWTQIVEAPNVTL